MKLHEVRNFLTALNSRELKARFLTTENFFSILCFKKKIQEYLDKIGEAETELAKAYDITSDDNKTWPKEFMDKLKECQQKEFTLKEKEFISQTDFKSWVNELPMDQVSILYDHLCKKESDEKVKEIQNGKPVKKLASTH